MQGQFWKNFRRSGRGYGRGNGPRSPATLFPPAGRAPRAGAGGAARLSGSSPVAPGDLPPRNRPIYYVRPALPDHAVLGKNKTAGRRPAVFAIHRVWSRVGVKRSRWGGFVAAIIPEPDQRRSEVGEQDTCRKMLPEKRNRPNKLPDLLKNLVGPPGFEPRTQGL